MAAAPLTDDEVVTVWGLVVEGFAATSARLRDDLDAEIGIPLGWLDVLLRLLRTPGHRLGMGALAQRTAITSGGFTRMADRLTAAGLVERQPCGSDRRVIWVALTPAGTELAERARTRHAAHLRTHVLDVLGTERAEQLAASMRVLRGPGWDTTPAPADVPRGDDDTAPCAAPGPTGASAGPAVDVGCGEQTDGPAPDGGTSPAAGTDDRRDPVVADDPGRAAALSACG